jgi:acylphosphatase
LADGDDSTSVKIRAHVFFDGLVQGVFFRANTKRFADSLGLTGWIRNTDDGRVEAMFEGEERAVKEVIEWCCTKQPYAKVKSKQVGLSEATDEFDVFSIVP